MRESLFLTMIFALLCASIVSADPADTLWTRCYGGDDHETAYSVRQTSDGGYIVAGETSSFGAGNWDAYLIRTDADGDTLWSRTYGGTELDSGTSGQQTSDGGYIIFGRTISFGMGENDYYLVKTDAGGDTVWTRTYGGSANDWGYDAQQTDDDGYILAGNSMSFGKLAQVFLVKTDVNGDTLWTRNYGGGSWEEASCVQQTTDGGYIVAGNSSSFGPGDSDCYLVRTDADGDTLWTRTYGGASFETANSVQQTTGGGYIVAGSTESFGAGGSDIWLLRMDSNGDTLWTRTFGDSLNDYGQSVRQTWDGGYIIGGYSNSFGGGDSDAYVVKTDGDGNTLWAQTYGGILSDGAWSIRQTTGGGYVFAGWCNSSLDHAADIWLVKLEGDLVPEVTAEMTPDEIPLSVPQGGSFGFTGKVTNNTGEDLLVDCWTMGEGPLDGVYGPFVMIYDLPLAPGQSLRGHFNQSVPRRTPLGIYTYIAYCGEFPSTVIDSAWFQVEVVEGAAAGGNEWILTGSFPEWEVHTAR